MTFARTLWLAAVFSLALPLTSSAQRGGGAGPRADTSNPLQEGLPLKPERVIRFTTDVGTWMSLDVSPDGQTILFDHLGDIFTVPMTGGKATAITKGMAVDAQPRFSPDGKRIAFISDRRGASNLWHMSLDLRDTVQVTTGRTDSYDSPEWTPDGKYLVVSRGNNLHMFHVDGGAGVQLGAPPAAAATGRGGAAPATGRYIGAAFGKDPRYIWAARRTATGQWTYNDPMGGGYSLVVYDRNTGEFSNRGTRWGAAFRPTLSPDGKWLVYATRHDTQTGLRIRDLETDQERWLAYPVQRDDQESRASRDIYPGMTFTPDSKNLIATWEGKIWSVPVAGGAPRQIPFSVDVEQHLGPEVRFDYPLTDSATFTIRQIRNAVPSPDGKKLAFTALDRLYVMDLPGGAPRMLSDAPGLEFQPAWSPDGLWIAFASWTEAEMGHLWKTRVTGGNPVKLTQKPGAYQQPVFTMDGQRVVAVRASAPAYAEETNRGGADLVWVPAAGGPTTLIAPAAGASNPHFVKGSDRIYASSGARGLISMRWDGTDIQEHVRIAAGGPAGGGGGGGGGGGASWIRMAPEGDQALAVLGNDIYVATVPVIGGTTPTVTCSNTPNFPCRRLTEIGGAFPAWSADSKKVHYSMGNAHAIYDLERAKIVEDSVRLATRNRPQRDSAARRDSAGPPVPPARPVDPEDSTRANAPAPQTRAANAYKPQEFRIIVKAQRDIPQSSAVLRGARVVTMRGDEVIENADIVIRNNRIAAIGARGSVQIPNGAQVIDVAGKTITPGFVDTHAHLRVPQTIHRGEVWSFAANLAYGVTTTRDPQTGSTDIFTYEDMIESGDILGPRGLSTGPGVFSGENFRNLEHARQVLKRYSDYYGTGTIKQYVAGNREQRQWIIQAAREQKLMPTTEGSLDLEMNISEAIDGYSGHEHTWPGFPFQSDLIDFFAKSGIAYTPTIIVAYGGPWAENYWYEHTNPHADAKLRRLIPHAELDAKTLRRASGGQAGGWFSDDEYIMKYVSAQVGDFVAAGGHAGIGSHGQFQGMGYHWELWSVAWDKEKVPPHMALRIATIMGAEDIGRGKDIGSVEVGKLADLVVLDRNPLDDIRNSNSIRYVMKNGRLYDGNTLDEIYPRKKKASFYWQQGEPGVVEGSGGGTVEPPGSMKK
jgi:Tol biopolymer transport system component